MSIHADQTQESKSQSTSSNTVYQKKSDIEPTHQFVDEREGTAVQRKMQDMLNSSPRAMQLRSFQDMADDSSKRDRAVQLQEMSNNFTSNKQQPIQKKENNTGLPDNLKSGIENISGYAMDDVKVHYNSTKPAQLNAHAYAQGSDIHLGSGQEKHLPHEAWHVVQQKQGRVKPTKQMKAKVGINDDVALEKEADVMGAKALQMKENYFNKIQTKQSAQVMDYNNASALQLKALAAGKLNVVGETHKDSDKRRNSEKAIAKRVVGGGYWTEAEFRIGKEQNPLQFMFQSDNRKYGDSSALLVEMNAAMLAEGAVRWSKYTGDYPSLEEDAKKGLEKAARALYRFGEAAVIHNNRIKDAANKKDSLVKDVSKLLTIFKAIGERTDESICSGLGKAGEAVSAHLGGRSSDDISKERSVHMDSSAESDVKKGVWKVGDDHIAQIKAVKTGAYEILSKAEFNTEYSDELKND